jgi:PASTA domain/Putative Ig domain
VSSHVQSTSQVLTSSGTTFTLTLTATAGNVLLVLFKLTLQGGGTAVTGVSDNRNGSYGAALANQLNTAGSSRFYAFVKANVAAGSTTVTVTVNQTGCVGRWILAEYSGVDIENLLDSVILSDDFASGSTITTGSITTGAANARVISAIATDSTATAIAPNSGETERIEVSARVQLQDEVVASPGAYTASWALTAAQAGNYILFALRDAAVAPSITSVDTDNIFTATQTNVAIVCAGAGSSTGQLHLIDGDIEVAQSIDSWSATAIQFDVVLGGCRYGALTLRLTTSTGLIATKAVTVNPPSGTTVVQLATLRALTFDVNNCPSRAYDEPGDIPNGAQLRLRGTAGSGSVGADDDGRLFWDDTRTQSDVDWNDGSGWNNASWDLRGLFPKFIGPPVVSVSYEVGTAIPTLAMAVRFTDPDDTSGTYSVTPALPSGLSLNTSTGDITGTPSGFAGTTNHVVTRADPLGSEAYSDSFAIIIDAAPVAPVYNPPIVAPDGTEGVAYEFDVSAFFSFGATYGLTPSLATAGLSGLSFNTSTGEITGTPTVTGSFGPFVASAINSDGTALSDGFTITIEEPIVLMPLVKGEQIADAITILTALGILVETRDQVSSAPVGEVLDQSIPVDAEVSPGITVILTVAIEQIARFRNQVTHQRRRHRFI